MLWIQNSKVQNEWPSNIAELLLIGNIRGKHFVYSIFSLGTMMKWNGLAGLLENEQSIEYNVRIFGGCFFVPRKLS